MSLDRTIAYVSSKGERIDFCEGGPWHAVSTDLFDMDVPYVLGNGAILGFSDGARTNALGVRLKCGSSEERDRLFDIITTDIANETPGTIYLGDWYSAGYVIGAAVTRWHISEGTLSADLGLLRTTRFWTCDHSQFLQRGDRGIGLNFPFNFPFNFWGRTANGSHVSTESAIPAPVTLTIYGPAQNPRVSIGGNAYEIEGNVVEGGKLVIDGIAKTITLLDEWGNSENAFSKRRGTQREGSGSYIFHRLPQDIHPVTWDGSFAMTITVHERREERRWS